MTNSRNAGEVRMALTAQDPHLRMDVDLARQLLTVESGLSMERLQEAIAAAGFLAVPQRRQSDRVDRAGLLQVAESTVVWAAGALYVGFGAGLILGVLRIDLGLAGVAMFGIGLALLASLAVGGFTLVRSTRRLYRRIEGERYLRATRRRRPLLEEDGTAGYAWVGRRQAS